jgi:hypothetical protein
LPKNIKIKIHKTIIFLVVLYEGETWNKHRVRTFLEYAPEENILSEEGLTGG